VSNKPIMVPLEGTRQNADPAAWKIFMRDLKSGFATTTHHAVLVFGVIAIGILAMMFVKPELADRLQELSPFTTAAAEPDPALAREQAIMSAAEHVAHPMAPMPNELAARGANTATTVSVAAKNPAPAGADHQQQQWVTQWLSKRYRVAHDATTMLVGAAYSTAKEMKLDPLLILAVMAIESGLNPFAESPVGAQGLMQVMAKVHHDKFQHLGGVKAALNPVANIKVGALILKDYVTRGGSVEAGLKMYVGAAAFDSDSGYGAKVLAEYRRLKDVATGKKVPTITTARAPAPKPRTAEPADSPLPVEAENRTNEQPKQSRLENDQMTAL